MSNLRGPAKFPFLTMAFSAVNFVHVK